MPTITINGVDCSFEKGERILDIANRNGVEIPQYCYHPGLSIPAQCRICLAEIHAPNPRNDNKIEPMAGGKLMPTCSTEAMDGMVVYADSPKAVANQKAVMEYLLINHPLDCPVCDQAGECSLQDYSYKYGRGVSRFEEVKLKQAKKDLGPHVYVYSDRCIMCTRCVRFTRELPATGEIMINSRGNKSEIDVFPGVALDNELSGNVVDLCPVGALLDKDFLFAQRVWFLKNTPSIDGITASGDNILIEHNEGKVYRLKPRENMAVNQWWITDEVRYGWKFIHSEDRLTSPRRRQHGTLIDVDWTKAYDRALSGIRESLEQGKRLGLILSPMLPTEEAYALASVAKALDPNACIGLGPVPFKGEDKTFPPTASPEDDHAFTMVAEKAPNARGVRRVIEAVTGAPAVEHDDHLNQIEHDNVGAVIVTGNYPSEWAAGRTLEVLRDRFTVVIDTLESELAASADVVLPGATWAEKAGSFENVRGRIQGFEAAIPVIEFAKTEGQIATDLEALRRGDELDRPFIAGGVLVVDEQNGQVPAATGAVAIPRAHTLFNAANTRREMAESHEGLRVVVEEIHLPAAAAKQKADVELVEL